MEKEVEVCKNCGSDESESLHTCPFKAEIRNDDETLCNCCETCRDICRDSI